MTHFNELQHILNQHFKIDKRRMACFVPLIIALFFKQTSNLSKLSSMFANKAKTDSSYRRIQRFLSVQVIDFNVLAPLVFQLFKLDKVQLTLNRTNWKWGKKTLIF